jgi:hypothetical protein
MSPPATSYISRTTTTHLRARPKSAQRMVYLSIHYLSYLPIYHPSAMSLSAH